MNSLSWCHIHIYLSMFLCMRIGTPSSFLNVWRIFGKFMLRTALTTLRYHTTNKKHSKKPTDSCTSPPVTYVLISFSRRLLVFYRQTCVWDSRRHRIGSSTLLMMINWIHLYLIRYNRCNLGTTCLKNMWTELGFRYQSVA